MTSTLGSPPRAYADSQFVDRTMTYRPGEVLSSLYRRFGPVVQAGRGRHGYTYLLGPEANRFVFANSDRFRWRDAYEWLVPVDGATSVLLSDGAEHQQRRKLVRPALHHKQIGEYLDIMAGNADSAIDTWRSGTVIDVYQELRAVIRRNTLETLFGPRLAADEDLFGTQLQVLLDLCGGLPQVVAAKKWLATPQWRRAMAARARVDERIYAEIDQVRADAGPAHHNVLASLVHGRDEDGNGLSDEEIRDQAVTLIVAGYETTSAATAWAVYAMLSTPGVWERARDEVHSVVGQRWPTTDDLPHLGYVNGVVQETLRLYPSVVVVGRRVDQDMEFGGRGIREGSMVVVSPYVTHRLPEVWADPLRFRPERWDTQQPGHRKPAPYEFLPFGGGPHRCAGSTMATTEMAVVLSRVLAQASLSLRAQRIRPVGMISMRPRRGLLTSVDQ